jgi:hypothetical protein
MMRFPFWFAEALVEYRRTPPLPCVRKSAEATENSFGRVIWEIGAVLATGLCVAAFAEVVLRANGIG